MPSNGSWRGGFPKLLKACIGEAQEQGILPSKPRASLDATGLETSFASSYFVRRSPGRVYRGTHYPKLTFLVENSTHLILGIHTNRGPGNDSPQFAPTLRMGVGNLALDTVLADSGYDAEKHHVLGRQRLQVRSTVIALNRRDTGRKWPQTKYRRQMKKRFPHRLYRQRNHAESLVSRHKRRLLPTLRARKPITQRHEIRRRVLTHNLMILKRRQDFNRAA